MHGNDRSTSQISIGWIDLFDDNMENIVDTYRISIKSIDDKYRIGSVKRYRAPPHSVGSLCASKSHIHMISETLRIKRDLHLTIFKLFIAYIQKKERLSIIPIFLKWDGGMPPTLSCYIL